MKHFAKVFILGREYLAILKVLKWFCAKIRAFGCKLGHLGVNSSKYFMNRQVVLFDCGGCDKRYKYSSTRPQEKMPNFL